MEILYAGGATPDTSSSGGSGGSGVTVTAINKTGATIFTGQKVWLNENAQTQGSSYEFDSSSASTSKLAVIDTIGTFAYKNGKFYSINNESATYVGDSNSSTDLALIRYGADGSVFACGNRVARIDSQAQWWSSDLGYYVESGWAVNSNKLLQFDMANGTVIKTLTFGLNNMGDSECIKIGDYIYRLNGNARTKYLIDYDNLTLTSSSYTFTNVPYQYSIYPLDKTADNKYILCNTEYNVSVGSNGSRLYIVEVLEDGNLRGLLQSEMPVDLQKWYSTACGYNFNPYTGILIVYEYQGSDYGIYRYEGNGTWTQLPIDLGIAENTSFRGAITISNDLSRACYNYYRSSGSYTYMPSVIVNLTTNQGYAAVPYRFYNVTENTITGYAGNDTEADGEVIVGIGSVPVIDNGGGNYEPTTPQLEETVLDPNYVDTAKVLSVGRVFKNANNEPTAMDYATLTEDSGAIVYSDGSFNSEEKLVADEFVMKFYLSDRVGDEYMKNQFIYLFGHNTASDGGNWWDETDRSDQFAIVFGFDSEWNYRTVGVNTGFVDENGWHSPNTRVDIGGELQFGWNTIKMYYNNDVQSWVLAFGDNFSMEYSIPELPKVCKPYNLNEFVSNAGMGDNCVDLAETGFKLNGEWVWRAIK